jgi:transmembrane sensor
VSNVRLLLSQEQRLGEASHWIAKLERKLSREEEKKLKQWMSADAKNEAELLSLAKLWDQMDALSQLSEVIPHTGHESTRKRLAIAASVILAVAVSAAVLFDNQLVETPIEVVQNDEARYETPVGDQSTIHLNDGSIVQLNTNTRLDVSMLPNQRLLTLERGEIHINVAHDPARPLRVVVGNRVIEAIGTKFNVRIDDSQQIELIVTEGRVSVGIRLGAGGESAIDQSVIELIAENERIRLDEPRRQTVEVLEPEEIEVRLSWRNGNLIFRGESLSSAVSEVGRYTNMEFIIQSEELKQVRVAGLFRAGDVEGFLRSLRTNFDIVDERIDGNTISLSQRSQSLETQAN